MLAVCDQDGVRKLHTFGYFREWPGNANIYQNVVEAATKYLGLYQKLQEMNKEVARDGGEPLPESPEAIPTWERMKEVAAKVERLPQRTGWRHISTTSKPARP